MSLPLARNAHNRILDRVAARTGLSVGEVRFMVKSYWRWVKYYLHRPWILPPTYSIPIGPVLRFVLSHNLILRHAFWEDKDAQGNGSIFSLMDRILLKNPTRHYLRLRNGRFEYYRNKLAEGYVNGPPKPKKEILAYMFITRAQAERIAREAASKSLSQK